MEVVEKKNKKKKHVLTIISAASLVKPDPFRNKASGPSHAEHKMDSDNYPNNWNYDRYFHYCSLSIQTNFSVDEQNICFAPKKINQKIKIFLPSNVT